MMFGSELPGSQSKMRNTFKLCTLIIKHGEDLLVSQEEVCVVVQMLLFSLQQVRVSSSGSPFFCGRSQGILTSVICLLSPGRPLGLCSSPVVPGQQAASRSSSLTHREPGDPQPPTGEKGWEAPGQWGVPANNSVTSSCLFLSAVTDGIPVTSEGKIQAALKLEHIDGVHLVSQGLGGEEGTLRHIPLKKSQGYRYGVAGPSFP